MLVEAVDVAQGALARVLSLQDGSADRAAPGVVPGDKKLGLGEAERFAQRSGYPGVLRDRADERHRPVDRPPLDNAALEVAGHGVAQSAQDLGGRIALLLSVDHVALGKDRTPPGDARGASCRAHHPAHLLDPVLHAHRLLVDKGARTGGALAAAVVIEDGPVFEPQVARALAADLEHRPDLRIVRRHHARDGLEFVLEVQPQDFGDGAAAGPGDPDSIDARLRDDLVKCLQQVVGGLDGATGYAAVFGKNQWGVPFDETKRGILGAQRLEGGAVLRAAQGG